MTTYRWDRATHTRELILDGPFGRYSIRRLGPRARMFRAYLNNKPTSFFGDKEEHVRATVERVLRADEIAKVTP